MVGVNVAARTLADLGDPLDRDAVPPDNLADLADRNRHGAVFFFHYLFMAKIMDIKGYNKGQGVLRAYKRRGGN